MALPRNTPMLTVAALIERLQKLPPDAVVVQSQDGEGNGFSPVADLALGVYAEETTWSGEFSDHDDDMQDLSANGGVQSVCIWPTN